MPTLGPAQPTMADQAPKINFSVPLSLWLELHNLWNLYMKWGSSNFYKKCSNCDRGKIGIEDRNGTSFLRKMLLRLESPMQALESKSI
jgi:hypothetical protein